MFVVVVVVVVARLLYSILRSSTQPVRRSCHVSALSTDSRYKFNLDRHVRDVCSVRRRVTPAAERHRSRAYTANHGEDKGERVIRILRGGH